MTTAAAIVTSYSLSSSAFTSDMFDIRVIQLLLFIAIIRCVFIVSECVRSALFQINTTVTTGPWLREKHGYVY